MPVPAQRYGPPPAPVSSASPAPPPGQVADVVVNMRGIEIADVAEQISRITGRTLILDPNVRGIVNVTSAEPLTRTGVWDLFQSVLRVHGFAAVRSGKAWRIIPQAAAIRDAGVGGVANGQEVTTRLVRLRNMPAEAAARALRPLVAQFGSVEALTSPNAIVVTDYAENVRRVERLAQSLDAGGAGGFESFLLKNASAREVATAIQGVIGEPGGAGGPRVVADERSNTVLVRGEPGALAQARRLVRVLDQPGGATPITRMFRLNNADAASVTEVLRGVLGQPGGTTNPVARALAGGRASLDRGGALNGGNLGLGNGQSALGATPATTVIGAATGTSTQGQTFGQQLTGGSGGQGGAEAQAQGFSTPDLTVQPAVELNAIVVRGTPSAIAQIETLVADLDVRRPQVLIEAAIVEITGDQAEALGVQLGFGAAAIGAADGGATSFSNLGLPLRQILGLIGAPAAAAVLTDGGSANVRIGDNFSVLLQALGQSTKANLLSTPSVTVLDNEAADIVVGQNVPFRTGSFASDSSSLGAFTTIQRQDVGITLKVVPSIRQGNTVQLDVAQEVSSLIGAVTGAADLITNRRAIQTKVLADDGGTIVLGGLISDDRMQVKSQVPILGDVPIVGELFKSRRESRTKRTLFVFLRPTILRDKASADAVTRGRYDRARGAEAVLGENGSLLLHKPQPRLTVEIEGIY